MFSNTIKGEENPLENDSLKEKRISFVAAPYINYSRTGGFAIGALPMMMYDLNRKDTISPTSLTGGLGLYTTNKNWFTMMFQKLYFKEDNWRIATAFGIGEFGFQFFVDMPGFSNFVDYNTSASFFYTDVQKKIVGKLYGGVHYMYNVTNTTTELTPQVDEKVFQTTGLLTAYDTRDDVYYPLKGLITNLKWSSTPELLKNEFITNKIDFDINQYITLVAKKGILALRGKLGIGLGDITFEQEFIVGRTDIRGYTEGKFRGKHLLAIQGEYRWNFHEKIGAVFFGGLATVFEATNDNQNGMLLPGIGAGIRYNVFPKNHMNIGIDAAIGKEDWGIYFKIGEAF